MSEGTAAVFHHLSRFNLSHRVVDAVDDGICLLDELSNYQPKGWNLAETDALRQLAGSTKKPSRHERIKVNQVQQSGVPPTTRRPDFPTLRENVDREAAKRKLETSADARDEAIFSLLRDQYAHSTRRPRDVCWATWCTKADMMGVQPLPLQIDNFSAIMSAFKAEGHKSLRNHTSRARQEHLTALKAHPANNVLAHISRCERSVSVVWRNRSTSQASS
jgi:hypothetical protein